MDFPGPARLGYSTPAPNLTADADGEPSKLPAAGPRRSDEPPHHLTPHASALQGPRHAWRHGTAPTSPSLSPHQPRAALLHRRTLISAHRWVVAMAARWCLVLLVVVLAASATARAGAKKGEWDPVIRMPGEKEPAATRGGEDKEEDDGVGTRWAVLVAGSNGYGNYRHQVCMCFRVLLRSQIDLRAWNVILLRNYSGRIKLASNFKISVPCLFD